MEQPLVKIFDIPRVSLVYYIIECKVYWWGRADTNYEVCWILVKVFERVKFPSLDEISTPFSAAGCHCQ